MRVPFILLCLAACTQGPVPEPGRTFRDPAAVIASKADLDPARLAGPWYEVARFPPAAPCTTPRVAIRPNGKGFAFDGPCDAGSVGATITGPGRLTFDDGSARWVLWTDAGYRTAILAAPDGSAGRILNRDPALPVDRLRAALEVLDFNGFQTDALIFAGPP
ncbi:lipocalin family protein [Jannaschia sp. S6380]|uniref:lipocalin family protein n=1 Tax=Jannaschia sp. S6380 TaxID=2926408 RepID=UPI001FF6907D|nr:lipocalin family protein [Jannaschia sp. S6380]MCK0169283.1 lipocalin family protein [Jannaschia sp. S6380]